MKAPQLRLKSYDLKRVTESTMIDGPNPYSVAQSPAACGLAGAGGLGGGCSLPHVFACVQCHTIIIIILLIYLFTVGREIVNIYINYYIQTN